MISEFAQPIRDVLQISFSRDIDPEAFLELCASPALYPLREDIVGKATDWSSNTTILVTNGPFYRPYLPSGREY